MDESSLTVSPVSGKICNRKAPANFTQYAGEHSMPFLLTDVLLTDVLLTDMLLTDVLLTDVNPA